MIYLLLYLLPIISYAVPNCPLYLFDIKDRNYYSLRIAGFKLMLTHNNALSKRCFEEALSLYLNRISREKIDINNNFYKSLDTKSISQAKYYQSNVLNSFANNKPAPLPNDIPNTKKHPFIISDNDKKLQQISDHQQLPFINNLPSTVPDLNGYNSDYNNNNNIDKYLHKCESVTNCYYESNTDKSNIVEIYNKQLNNQKNMYNL